MIETGPQRRRGCLYPTATAVEGDWSGEARDPDVLDHETADRLLEGAPWRRMATLGDSIVEGMAEETPGYAPVHWCGRLADALRRATPGLEHLNLGRRDLRAKEIREQQLPAALEWRPDLALVLGGGNDLLDPDFDAERTVVQLEAMAEELKATGATVVSCTMFDIAKALELPPELGAELEIRLHALFAAIRRMSERQGTILIDFAAEPVGADPGIYSRDFKHANARGHAIAASIATRRLGRVVGTCGYTT